MWFLPALIAVPLIEIALFIGVGQAIGVWSTLGLVVLSALLGTVVLRWNAARTLVEGRRSLAELRDPSRLLAHGALVMVAGMLLIVPGFLSDIIGALLLIPPVRTALMTGLGRRVAVRRVPGGLPRDPHRPPFRHGVIDGDYIVEAEDDGPRPVPPLPDGRPYP